MQKKKHRWGLWFLKITCGSILLFLITCFIFDRLVQFRMSDAELQTLFNTHHLPAQIRYYQKDGHTIRYAAIGTHSLPTVLFIHGAPGSLSIYKDYFTDSVLLKNVKMYAVDRPGYGYSGFGEPEPSIQKQAMMIRPILDSLNQVTRPVI